MEKSNERNMTILGIFIFLGLAVLGYLLASAAIDYKEYERTVNVKGLSEKEYIADIVIWPIEFVSADNDMANLYTSLEANAEKIRFFLLKNGLEDKEISIAAPKVVDKLAREYGDGNYGRYRYTAKQGLTVYSDKIETVRSLMKKIGELGKQGIVFNADDYGNQPEYIFTRLNEVKPAMIAEATTKAREVALKFAIDSESTLGKIKKASQGQFSISARDNNNPHIKKVRVVSTITYYLSD
ncbi:MAG: hypothetical protein B7C24_05375 [Bacteroidetes bacterium 4572_77]|nr:MAG: hypothetical protein B7C24_05375 [Bacteroidetes bacterium 4572_77]